jgi:hypothetical protein
MGPNVICFSSVQPAAALCSFHKRLSQTSRSTRKKSNLGSSTRMRNADAKGAPPRCNGSICTHPLPIGEDELHLLHQGPRAATVLRSGLAIKFNHMQLFPYSHTRSSWYPGYGKKTKASNTKTGSGGYIPQEVHRPYFVHNMPQIVSTPGCSS